MNNLDKELVEYLVSYYTKDGLLKHVAEFGFFENAKHFAKHQQKHYEGVDLIVVKRTSKLELV